MMSLTFSTLGNGALMAKVDLKFAFRMVPVLLGMKWNKAYNSITSTDPYNPLG